MSTLETLKVGAPLAEGKVFLCIFGGLAAVILGKLLFGIRLVILVLFYAGCIILSSRFKSGGRAPKLPSLHGKVAIITGANTGIGQENAKIFAEKGAKVILACRDTKKGESAARYVAEAAKKAGHPGDSTQVSVMPLDLADLNSVRKFVEDFKAKNLPLHILINNAGVMFCPFTKTAQGLEMQFGTNHIGHFYLTTLLLDLIKQNKARVVNVSSYGHVFAGDGKDWKVENLNCLDPKKYNPVTSYGYSKLANIHFSMELQNRIGESGASAYSAHPGAVATELTRHTGWMASVQPWTTGFLSKTPWEGAQTQVFCATSDRAVPGKFHADCRKSPTTNLAKDSAKAKELWAFSEKLIAEALPK